MPSKSEVAFLHAGAVNRIRYISIVTVVVLLLLSTIGVAGRLWVVINNPPDPTHVTNLQGNEVGSLPWAIANAPSGSTITFDESLHGTILLTNNDLNIGRNLTIRGPGAGTLSISSGKSGHMVRVIQGVSATISGLTFKNSKTPMGIIYNEGTLMLVNSTISGNTASSNGGILNKGTLSLTNSIVSGNTATGCCIGGGGILNNGTLTLSNSTVSGNTATNGNGGGIDNEFGTVILSNSTVSGNTAAGFGGGGIYNFQSGRLLLINSTVSSNTAIDGDGGGIYNSRYSTLMLSNSTIVDNTASHISTFPSDIVFNGSGGGIYNNGTLTVSNSTISDNKAAGNGGGIAISESEVFVGVPPPLSAMLLYCTVYSNTSGDGGGIWIGNLNKQDQVNMGASIVAGNAAHTSPDIVGRLTTLGYNLVGDRSDATFLGSPKVQSTDVLGVLLTKLGIDPVLRDNGGSVRPHTWTHALLPGSPAIDLIPPDVCMMFKVFNDQRGVKRPQGKGCDSGAYEYKPSS